MEIANLKSSLVRKLNKNGLSPMHLALEGGHWSIARGLLQTDKQIVRVKGKGGRTPLHEAAVKGNTDLLIEFLSASPESIEDLTVQLETALHLAVTSSKLEAFELLMKWVKEENKMRIANWKDDEGNNVFHVATSTNQIEFVKLLLSKRYKRELEVNAINSEGLTAADLIGLQTREGENPDQILRHAGALKAQEISSDKRSFMHVIFKVLNHLTTILSEEYLYYFRYRRDRDSPSEVRNVLLVVLGLIVSATYQTGVSPPSLHLPPGFIPFINTTSISIIHGQRLCRLFRRSDNDDGLDIYVYPQFNSLAFFFSLAMMVVLTTGFPMQIELMIALVLLVFNFLQSSAVFQGPGYFLNPFSWFSFCGSSGKQCDYSWSWDSWEDLENLQQLLIQYLILETQTPWKHLWSDKCMHDTL